MPQDYKEKSDEKKEMESALNNHNLDVAGPVNGSQPALQQASARTIKVRLALKAAVFCFSVVTLSWFFEGMRECKEMASAQGLGYLIGGTVLTLLLICLQGFFIYCEERSKGQAHAADCFV